MTVVPSEMDSAPLTQSQITELRRAVAEMQTAVAEMQRALKPPQRGSVRESRTKAS